MIAPLMLRRARVLSLLAVLAACGQQTGLGLQLVPEEQVQQMGVQAWQQIRAETQVSDQPQMRQRADRVATRVLRAAGENPAEWEVVVFKGEEANAFALPGKKIGVYEGMMRLAGTDAQLASVIGHEIAHVEADHSSERVNSEMATNLGVDIASMVLGETLGAPNLVAGLLGAGAQYGMLLPYSRNQELEADRLGLQMMAVAGYDPRAAIELWQGMAAQGGAQPPAFLSTHPAHGDRIAQLQAMMPEALAAYEQAR